MRRPNKRANLFLGLAVLLAGLILLPGCVADRLIFHPPANRQGASGEFGVALPEGGRIAMLYAAAPPGGKTILFSHGNGEVLRYLAPRLEGFRAHGYGVAAYDYEGYGTSFGVRPSEAGCERAIMAAYRYLRGKRGLKPEEIVIYGFSLGTGPSCYLAEREPAAALVLEAPFTSTFAVANLGWLPFDRFPNLRRISGVRIPVWVICGERDNVIPPVHGRRLHAAANSPKRFWIVPGAGHNNITLLGGETYWRQLADFLGD